MPVEALSTQTRPSAKNSVWIEVRPEAIQRNLERLREKIRPFTRVMAVVKANAYGHGLVPIAQALQGKVDFLGIGSLKEASILREHGVLAPLFLFGRLFRDEIPIALQMNLTVTVSSFEEARDISEFSAQYLKKEKARLHIKVDTGMGRLGVPLREALSEIEKIAALPGLQLDGIYTHFPTAEQFPDSFTQKQLSDFEQLVEDLRRKGISFVFRHAANSAGALRFRSTSLNLVRPGIVLYGVHPHPSLEAEIDLEPGLSLKTRVAFVKQIQAGESVGYGREFVAEAPTTIAVLPIGYAHGYPFHLSRKGEVLMGGRRFPLAGRICMDALMVDLGSSSGVQVGEEAVLLGNSGEERISATQLASLAGTIPYEIMTRLDPSLPRLYL